MLSLFQYLLEFIVPSTCVVCGNSVSIIDNNLCDSCFSKFKYLEKNCNICSSEIDEGGCSFCSSRTVYFDKNISIFEYNDVVKELLHYMKFNNYKYLFRHFGAIATKKIFDLEMSFDLITYIPMNKKKKWARGYNQSELLAKDVASKYGCSFLEIFSEKKSAGTQRELGYKERFINVLGRYEINKNIPAHKIIDKTVLVVDDVFTSGATLNEAARKLKEFGVREVFTLTIAKTKTRE